MKYSKYFHATFRDGVSSFRGTPYESYVPRNSRETQTRNGWSAGGGVNWGGNEIPERESSAVRALSRHGAARLAAESETAPEPLVVRDASFGAIQGRGIHEWDFWKSLNAANERRYGIEASRGR